MVTKYTLFAQKLHVTTKYDFEYLSLQTEMHASESLVPEPSLFDVEIAIEKLERYKSLGTSQVLAEPIQAGSNKQHFGIHKLIHCVWNN